jgi:hypothetical protein
MHLPRTVQARSKYLCGCPGVYRQQQRVQPVTHLEGRSGKYSRVISSRKPVTESSKPSTTTSADASTGRGCNTTAESQHNPSIKRSEPEILYINTATADNHRQAATNAFACIM